MTNYLGLPLPFDYDIIKMYQTELQDKKYNIRALKHFSFEIFNIAAITFYPFL